MAANIEISNSLNEQQLMMLRLFKKPLSDEDFQLVRRLAVKLLVFITAFKAASCSLFSG
jgi:hypothetical protein